MIDLEELYFEWLLTCLDPNGVTEGVAHVGGLLHGCPFRRRVGNDINRAIDGINLRKEFLTKFEDADFDPRITNDLMDEECTWFEMLIALAKSLDYLYEGGVDGRFIELVTNMGLDPMLAFNLNRAGVVAQYDQHYVDSVTDRIDNNRFDRDGRGGIFPLRMNNHPDQREVEIWDQHAAYFYERFEGVMWTSTN